MSNIHRKWANCTGKQTFLVIGLVAVVLIAGCLGGGGSDPGGNSTELDDAEQGLNVRDISWDGGNMVVNLNSGNDIKKINLISPDGSLFGSSDLATGETKASFQLLSPESGYPAGEYKLVTVKEDGSKNSEKIELHPELRIAEIGKRMVEIEAFGEKKTIPRLTVVIENTGTAPAWVYNMEFNNSPHYRDSDFTYDSSPSVGQPFKGVKAPGVIIQKSENKTLMHSTASSSQKLEAPSNDQGIYCDGSYNMTLLVQSFHEDLTKEFTVKLSGNVKKVGLYTGFCTNTTVMEGGI